MSPSKPLLLVLPSNFFVRAPNGIRTRVTAVKGRCPRPLDDGDVSRLGNLTRLKAGNQTALIALNYLLIERPTHSNCHSYILLT